MEQRDVIVVGGSAAGLTAALTAVRHYPSKSVLVIRREEQVLVPCGIPYIFGTLESAEKNVMPDAPYEANNIALMKANVTAIDRDKRILNTGAGDVQYDRLVLATGSMPIMPPIPGIELSGVCVIQKDLEYLKGLQNHLKTARNVVIVGGGFIGIEFADEINKMGDAKITVVEVAPHCLSLAYDDEFCAEMEEVIASRGIDIKTSLKVDRIEGTDRVERVRLSDGSEIEADTVILAIGAKANVDLAKKCGLRIDLTGSIAVDQTMLRVCPDPAVREKMPKRQGTGRGQTREDIVQIGPRINPKPFARDDQTVQHGRRVARALGITNLNPPIPGEGPFKVQEGPM